MRLSSPLPPSSIRLVALALLLAGCAAATTVVDGRHLDVQTRMTDTVFLDPAPPGGRTVHVEIRNTSDKPELDLGPNVRAALEARGYRLVDDPRDARLHLQANVLRAGRSARSAAEAAYRGGFGTALAGGTAGGAAGYGAGRLGGGDGTVAAIGGALAGAAIGGLADSYVQEVAYAVVADVQIAERALTGVVVTETEAVNLGQGIGGGRVQTSSRTGEWRRYRTRVVSTAEQANLEWAEAAPPIVAGLTRSIAGLF